MKPHHIRARHRRCNIRNSSHGERERKAQGTSCVLCRNRSFYHHDRRERFYEIRGTTRRNFAGGIMKTIVLNASPRKDWNTAQLLKAAMTGAESVGAETEYFNLYDLNFAGCRSCLLCKRKGAERCRCYWKDDLSPIIDKVFSAHALFIGTPIYLGRPTSQYFAFMERLHFCALSYDDYSNYFHGKVNVGMFLTMNATKEFYDKLYKEKFEAYASEFKALNGEVCLYPAYNTLQVVDYAKFDMSRFSEEEKKKTHDTCFPLDLENAYHLGARL